MSYKKKAKEGFECEKTREKETQKRGEKSRGFDYVRSLQRKEERRAAEIM